MHGIESKILAKITTGKVVILKESCETRSWGRRRNSDKNAILSAHRRRTERGSRVAEVRGILRGLMRGWMRLETYDYF